MKYFLSFLLIFLALNSISQTNTGQPQGVVKPTVGEADKNAGYTYTIIQASNNTWGYDIKAGKKVLIHQPVIPGLPGNEGFKTKSDAEKVARLVIGKIKKGELPPCVTIEELKKLKVL